MRFGLRPAVFGIIMGFLMGGCEDPSEHLFENLTFLPKGISIWDCNGDDIEDIIVNEGFHDNICYGTGESCMPLKGHLNDDKYIDLIGEKDGLLYIRYGKGFGSFEEPIVLKVPRFFEKIYGIAGADIDKDGDMDVVITYESGGRRHFMPFKNLARNGEVVYPEMKMV